MKFLWTALLSSWLVIGGLVYMFFIKGSVAEANDGRTAIVLTEGERDFVLAEMRGFLTAVQQIIEGVDEKDMKKVAEAGKAAGAAATRTMPGSLPRKLPLAFKQLGHPTHKAFDELAVEASDIGDAGHVIRKLGSLMTNCVACHATYKLEVGTK
ncbi:MAG: cytochrome c [bacterium]|nr:cytochrome c [bacterium]